MIGLDFETIGLEPKRGNLRLIQTANGKGGPSVMDAWGLTTDNLDLVLAALAGEELVAHNASFEEDWLRAYGVELPQGLHDTMIAWMVIRQPDAPIAPFRLPKSLEYIARPLRGEELDKEMQTSDWSAPTLSEEQPEYAERDAQIVLDLYEHLSKRLREEKLKRKSASSKTACGGPWTPWSATR
jgi:ribonuclease D